jgi:anaerobic selenocysteine-containing dehydrogenase
MANELASQTKFRTFCRVCEPACGLLAEVEDGRLTRLVADAQHPVTKGFVCTKGPAGTAIHHDPDRLNYPLRRTASATFERISWNEAMSDIGSQLRDLLDRHGPGAVAHYAGNPLAFNTLAGPQIRSFFGRIGAHRSFSSGTQDCANKFAGSEAVFGSSTIHPIPDIDHTDCLLIFGANPRVSHGSFISIANPTRVLSDAVKRGARVYYVNPRDIEPSQSAAGETVQIRPDTDLYLMAALLCEIDRIGGFRDDVMKAHGKNVEGLRDFVHCYPAERIAKVTGIAADTIRKIAREFSQAGAASAYMSTGVNMGRQGTLAYWLLHMLAFVTGNLDRRGGNILSVGFYKSAKAGRAEFDKRFATGAFGSLRKGPLPGNLLGNYILDAEEPIRALFVIAGNPLLSIGGESRMRAALRQLDLLVVMDLYRNATGEYAHYLLPSTDMFEREDINITGLGLQYQPYVQFTERVVAPLAERREEWWVLARLAEELGLPSRLGEEARAGLWDRIDHMLRTRGTSLDDVRSRPHGLVFEEGLQPGAFYGEQLQTADGKVDCCPHAFAAALDRAARIFAELEGEEENLLKLITRRDPHMHNSWYANVESMKRSTDRNYLFMHPEDARARGIGEGARVRLWNEHGSRELEVRDDPALRRGVVALTHGWGNAESPGMRVAQRTPGTNANALLPVGPGSFEPLSSQAFMTGVPVQVSPL